MTTRKQIDRQSVIIAIVLLCGIFIAGFMAAGCSTRNPEPETLNYSYHGPLLDGTNGVVQPPKW